MPLLAVSAAALAAVSGLLMTGQAGSPSPFVVEALAVAFALALSLCVFGLAAIDG